MNVLHSRLALDGDDWTLRGFLDEDWRRVRAYQATDAEGWLRCAVPGSVQHSLWQAGAIANPYVERNSLLCEWVPQRSWLYRRSFEALPLQPGQRARLRFEGVDYAAVFFLNGVSLGRHASLFTPAVFDVTHSHRPGENWLVVALDPAPSEPSQMGRTSHVRTLKPRMGYGWDFCPRLINLGLGSVTLEVTGPVTIRDVWVRSQVDLERGRATVQVETTLDGDAAASVEVSLWREGKCIASETGATDARQTATNIFELDAPALWYPNGHGPQPLYQARVRVLMKQGESDTRTVTFGLRHLEWVANEGAPPDALPYTPVVNGQRVYLKGWNWVPLDALYSVPRPAQLARLLTLAQQAHLNFLRLNGVGLVESEAFYDLCDRLGILVWQEFTLSSSAIDRLPSDDADYLRRVVAEAEGIIPQKRNHPCLALWDAGNELESLDFLPLDDRTPVIGALRDVVHRLDPDRHWLPTSASGPMPFNGINTIRNKPATLHDVHGPWFHQGLTAQYSLANEGVCLLHSEFGAEGLTNLRALEAIIGLDNRWPISRANPVWDHLGAGWWLNQTGWREVWGEIADLPTLVRASQLWQAEGVRYMVEANRRRQFHNSGSLPWQFNEPYPMAIGTTAVDYFGWPRPVYYAVARAYAPLSLTASFATQAWASRSDYEASVWLVADRPRSNLGTVTARLVGASGRCYGMREWRVDALGEHAAEVGALSVPLASIQEDVFCLDLTLTRDDGAPLSANRYLFSRTDALAPFLSVPPTTLAIAQEETGANEAVVRISNTGHTMALFVWLDDARPVDSDGYVYFDDNHFCLLPGEARRVRVMWTDVPAAERGLIGEAWNSTRDGPGA